MDRIYIDKWFEESFRKCCCQKRHVFFSVNSQFSSVHINCNILRNKCLCLQKIYIFLRCRTLFHLSALFIPFLENLGKCGKDFCWRMTVTATTTMTNYNNNNNNYNYIESLFCCVPSALVICRSNSSWNDIKNALDLDLNVFTFIKTQHRKNKGGFYKHFLMVLFPKQKEKRNRHLKTWRGRHTILWSGLKFPLIDVIKRAWQRRYK